MSTKSDFIVTHVLFGIHSCLQALLEGIAHAYDRHLQLGIDFWQSDGIIANCLIRSTIMNHEVGRFKCEKSKKLQEVKSHEYSLSSQSKNTTLSNC
jgi:hypothetical protein